MMYCREKKIINWLSQIQNDISGICQIFTHQLISDDDIGEAERIAIENNLQKTLVILDDILFKLEGGDNNGE